MAERGITRNRIRTFLATRKGPGLRLPASIPIDGRNRLRYLNAGPLSRKHSLCG